MIALIYRGSKCKNTEFQRSKIVSQKYVQIHAQNIARDFVPKHAPNIDFVLKCHAQSTDVMFKIQKLCSKYRNAHMYYAQKEKCSDQLCCMSDHFGEISGQI